MALLLFEEFVLGVGEGLAGGFVPGQKVVVVGLFAAVLALTVSQRACGCSWRRAVSS
ncbi:hypothetical protein WKI68_12870 [Streptomyces sp. MS1.HAVA.3]|uniref:Uncharacterized protein n=1 Tax=Streptomyces caledonius TaxID=3134107 RepID=A0ABU8U4L6_9ACTN